MSETQTNQSETYHKALSACEQITDAARLMKTAREVMAIAEHQASRASMETFLGDQMFVVTIPEEAEASIILDGNVLVTPCTNFTATELRSIGKHGVEFYNSTDRLELHMRSFDFEIAPLDTRQG